MSSTLGMILIRLCCASFYGRSSRCVCCFFFFNDTATTEIYTLSLHDALPISTPLWRWIRAYTRPISSPSARARRWRSEEHTSELQSHSDLVCRLLLEKKKQNRQR